MLPIVSDTYWMEKSCYESLQSSFMQNQPSKATTSTKLIYSTTQKSDSFDHLNHPCKPEWMWPRFFPVAFNLPSNDNAATGWVPVTKLPGKVDIQDVGQNVDELGGVTQGSAYGVCRIDVIQLWGNGEQETMKLL